jgi:16S rRNA (uracil1498-N3)-methyltransferase
LTLSGQRSRAYRARPRDRDPARLLVFCDEDAERKDPVAALTAARATHGSGDLALAVLIGPEGGFADDERAALVKAPNVVRLALGPRILRADTAAVAAMALVAAVLGDWGSGAPDGIARTLWHSTIRLSMMAA